MIFFIQTTISKLTPSTPKWVRYAALTARVWVRVREDVVGEKRGAWDARGRRQSNHLLLLVWQRQVGCAKNGWSRTVRIAKKG